MNNQFLIPANSKKSMLILGLFTETDLIIVGTGVGISMLLILFVDLSNVLVTILALLPGLVTSLLVMPFPNYRNVRTLIKEIYNFYNDRQRYVWKGWCIRDGEEK